MIKHRRQIIIILIVIVTSVFLFSCGLSTPFSFSTVEIGEPSSLPLESYMTTTTSFLHIKNADETSTVSTLSLRLVYYVETDPDLIVAHDDSYVGNIQKAWSKIYCDEPIQILSDSYHPVIRKDNTLLTEDNIELDRDFVFENIKLYSDINEDRDAVISLLDASKTSFDEVNTPLEFNAGDLPILQLNDLKLQIAEKYKNSEVDQYIYLYGYITAMGTSTPFTSELFLIGIYKYPATTN